MAKAIVVVDSNSTAQEVLGELFAKGLIGAWNGYHYNGGGAVVSVEIYDPSSFDYIDSHPKLTRIPEDFVAQKHVNKLPGEVKAALRSNGKIDDTGKLTGQVTAREFKQHLHGLYGSMTKHFHPDF